MRKPWLAVTVAVALLASCAPDVERTGLVVRRTLVVWGLDGSRAESALPEVPVDVLIEAGDGYTAVPLDAEGNGVYRLAEVPERRFFVRQRVSASYTVLQESSGGDHFVGQVRVGRSGATAVQSSTPLSIDATGLDPWQAGDLLDLYSPTLDAHPSVTATGTAGATSVTGAANLFTPFALPALDASKGDYAFVSQLRRTDLGPWSVRKLIRYGEVAATTPAGEATSITAALAAPSALRAVRLDLRAREFADALAGCGVATTGVSYSASVGWHPLASVPGPLANNRPKVVYLWSFDAVDLDLGTVAAPLPDPEWGTVVTAEASATVATPNGPMNWLVSSVRYRADASTPPLRPDVGPPRALAVEGQALAGAPVTGVGLTPVLTWDPPAWGTPTAYSVGVYQGGSLALLALVRSGRALRIPPEVLASGKAYWVVVVAWWAPGYQPGELPAFPWASSTAYSATTFTP